MAGSPSIRCSASSSSSAVNVVFDHRSVAEANMSEPLSRFEPVISAKGNLSAVLHQCICNFNIKGPISQLLSSAPSQNINISIYIYICFTTPKISKCYNKFKFLIGLAH